MFQTPPFYELVLLLPQLSVYGAPTWGPDELYITLHAPLKKRCDCGNLTASVHRKTVLLSCPQYKEQYEKVLEDVSAYTPRYMEEMESIFEQSQEEERKRISFLKQAFLSIHRHLDVTNNERWAAFSVCSNFISLLLMSLIFAQCESCVQWAPPNPDVHQWARGSQMVEEQSRPRHAYWLAKGWGVFNTFSAQRRCNIQTANNAMLPL